MTQQSQAQQTSSPAEAPRRIHDPRPEALIYGLLPMPWMLAWCLMFSVPVLLDHPQGMAEMVRPLGFGLVEMLILVAAHRLTRRRK